MHQICDIPFIFGQFLLEMQLQTINIVYNDTCTMSFGLNSLKGIELHSSIAVASKTISAIKQALCRKIFFDVCFRHPIIVWGISIMRN